ncbi:MAG: sensor histidine kinase, partial [Chloroflexi bacterium]|nr:sensor histidine kinase [Chloroflexota bacterium]
AIDPAYESTLAWAVREAVTNVVKHSGARRCRIELQVTEGSTTLQIRDDGRGGAHGSDGTGLHGLADRVQALGGTLEARRSAGGFSVQVLLGAATARATNGALTT